MSKSKVSQVLILIAITSLLIIPSSFAGMANEELIQKPLEIYFFPGGNPGGSYAVRVHKGAEKAAEILGNRVEMHYLWSDWSPEKMVSQFQEALAANPDGIAIMGHPGDEALRPFVEEAIEKDTVVTTMDTKLPELEKRYKAKGFGFAGEKQYDAGYKLAKEAVRRAGLSEGDKAVEYGIQEQPTRGDASRGAIDGLEEAGLEVDHLEISEEADKDPSAAIPTISGYLQKNPDIDLMVLDHANMTANMHTILESAGTSTDDFYVAGFGISKTTIEAIRSGYVDLVMDKQPFLQGFYAVYQIYLAKMGGFSGLDIPTGSGFITSENVDTIEPLVEKKIR